MSAMTGDHNAASVAVEPTITATRNAIRAPRSQGMQASPSLWEGGRGEGRHRNRSSIRTVLLSVCSVVSLSSCASVERRITITSEPTGAHVILNDTDVGYTPLEVDFTWFGTYELRASKPGYALIHENRTINAPLHEQPGIDILAAALPGKRSTRVEWHLVLTPETITDEDLILRARELQLSLDEADAPQ